jgi:hypothetical protein
MAKKRYIKIDMEGRNEKAVFRAMYSGHAMIMHHEAKFIREHNEKSDRKAFSIIAAEAYTTMRELYAYFPTEMAEAKEWLEREYPQYKTENNG